jgi:hypothetical protein
MAVFMAGRFLPEWAGSSALLKTTFRTESGYTFIFPLLLNYLILPNIFNFKEISIEFIYTIFQINVLTT